MSNVELNNALEEKVHTCRYKNFQTRSACDTTMETYYLAMAKCEYSQFGRTFRLYYGTGKYTAVSRSSNDCYYFMEHTTKKQRSSK